MKFWTLFFSEGFWTLFFSEEYWTLFFFKDPSWYFHFCFSVSVAILSKDATATLGRLPRGISFYVPTGTVTSSSPIQQSPRPPRSHLAQGCYRQGPLHLGKTSLLPTASKICPSLSADKSSSRETALWLLYYPIGSLGRSQCGSCSAAQDTEGHVSRLYRRIREIDIACLLYVRTSDKL